MPKKWIIVSDGSKDQTNEIILSYSKKYPFVHLSELEADNARNFGSQAKAFNYGSPEGHTWGTKAHNIIGRKLSNIILNKEREKESS